MYLQASILADELRGDIEIQERPVSAIIAPPSDVIQ